MEDGLLLTVPEVARVLRISRNLAYSLVACGDIPCIRLGRSIRIVRPTLEAWINDQQSARSAHD